MPNTATKKAPAKSNGNARSNGNGKSNGSKKTNGTNGKQQAKLSAENTTQLEKFFHDQIKDIYWAEKHLTKALPKMQKAATTEELKAAIGDHLVQTEEQIVRLEQVFELLGKKPQAKKCDGMEGLVKEGEHAVEETEKGSMTRDVAIIMSSQKVEHYEICSYGTLVQLAKTMGNNEIASLLETTLEEEKQTDQNLTHLAENNINAEAEGEEEEED